MYNNIERELKVLITKEIFNKILISYDFHNPITQTNTYYDDDQHSIKNQKGAMRIRTIGEKNIFTLKIKKDDYTHYEYEKEINTNKIEDIKDPEILRWKNQFNIPENVNKIAEFTTKRYTYEFENGELCLDETKYPNHTDYEIEYEYNKNHDGITFFNSVLKPFHIQWKKNCPSKIARAVND